MVGTPLNHRHVPNTMIRSVSLLALAGALLVSTLLTGAARAQMSESDLLLRIDHLEAQIRQQTGTIEQLQYRNQQLEQEVQRLQAGGPAASNTPPPKPTAQYPSSPYSPNPPAGGQYSPPAAGVAQYPPPSAPPYSPPPVYSPPPPAAVASATPVAPPAAPADSGTGGRRGDAFNPALSPNAPGVPRTLGSSTTANEPPPPVADNGAPGGRVPGAPLDLSAPSGGGGDLPPPPPANTSATGANTGNMQAALPPTLPPSATPKDEFDLGYGYVMHKDYGPAADTFRDFLKKYPADRMASDAQYWLGESLFQGQHYRDAAESFLAVSTKYDNPPRAPEALMRLGQSLAALGEKEAACASLGEVLRKYPKASPAIKQNVDREQKRVHC
jgi:tol-pal system protein YbgF